MQGRPPNPELVTQGTGLKPVQQSHNHGNCLQGGLRFSKSPKSDTGEVRTEKTEIDIKL
jgi:hypothetical protein